MTRKTQKDISDKGLLVGWSLEHQKRPPIFGFHSREEEKAPIDQLEPILLTGEGHLMTVAPTGAGKGVSCIIPALLRYQGPVVVVDPKGENYAITARRRREMGQKVVLLDPFKITGEENADSFNPFDLLDPRDPSFVENAAMLVSLLMTPSSGDVRNGDFWNNMGKLLITALVLHQARELEPDQQNLVKTRDLLGLPMDDLNELGKTFQYSDNDELKRLAGILFNPARETIGGYLAHAQHQMEFLKGSMIEDCLKTSTFSTEEVAAGDPLSIYLVLPPNKLESHGKLLRLWIGLFMSAIMKRRHKTDPATLFIIDEAAQLGTLPQLRQAVTLLRGYGVKVWSFWQDVSQIEHLYPADWKTLYNNCKVHQFFGLSTFFAAKAAHNITGYHSIDQILGLDESEMILSVAGDVSVIAQKPAYFSDEAFNGLYDENPFYVKKKYEKQIRPQQRVYNRKEATNPTEEPKKLPTTKKRPKKMLEKLMAKHPISADKWKSIRGNSKTALIKALSAKSDIPTAELKSFTYRRIDVSFYENYSYYEAKRKNDAGTTGYAYFLYSKKDDDVVVLDGKSEAIHSLNSRAPIVINADTALDYLYFFTYSINGDEGRFIIIDDVDDVSWDTPPSDEVREELNDQLFPPGPIDPPSDKKENSKSFWFTVCVLYSDAFFTTMFEVTTTGAIIMQSDESIATDLPVVRDIDVQLANFSIITGD